ncbi:hypothetical protein niasHT_034228 [Heterodera trifolii]|uniref:Fatty acid desaturase domain-containing protein n=1 Tax=Heterodera trifolii TaxID=157864 RepID=A0ABD2IJD6_9BILA
MVLTDSAHADPKNAVPFRLRIDGHWVRVDERLLRAHPGSGAMLAYRDREASTVFHSFHAGSKRAYRWMTEHREQNGGATAETEATMAEANGTATKTKKSNGTGAALLPPDKIDAINMGKFGKSAEANEKICRSFDVLRSRVRSLGLLRADDAFFVFKFIQCVALIAFAVFLQSRDFFLASALCMGIAWQQLGWMIHEYGHQQHFGSWWWNDVCGYVCGNLMQGFSLGGWKEQHNVHHAAPNVDGRDGDLDLLPLWATIGTQLKRIDGASPLAHLLPFQHLYWSFALPLLRFSWLLQSVQFVCQMRHSFYDIHRQRALVEQCSLALHWSLVLVQLYFLPDNLTRLQYFLVSNLFAGFLIAHVVTYNHYSTDKFAYDDPILENFACLQLYTTRNMRPGPFIDWLWGGLNYQIEHHLFPTMPRHNLKKVMPLVKEFCAENDIPYMVRTVQKCTQLMGLVPFASKLVRSPLDCDRETQKHTENQILKKFFFNFSVDDYFTGFRLVIEHLRRVAEAATETLVSHHSQKSAMNGHSSRK